MKFINSFTNLGEAFFSDTEIEPLSNVKMVHFNQNIADEIGFKKNDDELLKIFNGQQKLKGSQIYSTIYSGHQFGSYVPQLGDGRVNFFGEVENSKGDKFEIQVKGGGKTPYSRFGDGRAVLRSSIREYIVSHAMYKLGIPTTRALALISSDSFVQRESLEKAALTVRVSESFIRFGHFEYFTNTNQHEKTKKLADYIISKSFSKLQHEKDKYEKLYYNIVKRTAETIAKWQAFGFAHGVMNTDNMSILGQTIDYGPYGFLDDFDPSFIPNGSDYSGRYSYSSQPAIGQWNLQALAYAFQPVLNLDISYEILGMYKDLLRKHFNRLMSDKLGLYQVKNKDEDLIIELLSILDEQKIDYTIFFRMLCEYNFDIENNHIIKLFNRFEPIKSWLQKYKVRVMREGWPEANIDLQKFLEKRSGLMKVKNPKFIARNYMLENAITMANKDDFSEVKNLFDILSKPFDEQPENETYAMHPPSWSKDICVTCSS